MSDQGFGTSIIGRAEFGLVAFTFPLLFLTGSGYTIVILALACMPEAFLTVYPATAF